VLFWGLIGYRLRSGVARSFGELEAKSKNLARSAKALVTPFAMPLMVTHPYVSH